MGIAQFREDPYLCIRKVSHIKNYVNHKLVIS